MVFAAIVAISHSLAIADDPTDRLGTPTQSAQVARSSAVNLSLTSPVKPSPIPRRENPRLFSLIPTRWDAQIILIPTQWDVHVALVTRSPRSSPMHSR
jgi:hypothetical protein